MIEMAPYATRYLPYLQNEHQVMLDRLATLVNIDSGTGQVEGINRISALLARWLDELGFVITLHESDSFGKNLVARRRGLGQRRILLVGHIDTVYPAGAALSNPFTLRDGRAYGPGVIDMKAGIVMGIHALQVLLEAGFTQYEQLCFVINNDEEVGSPGSTPLIRDIAATMDVGLVLEPARAAHILTRARKGADKYILEVRGIPAHSGAEPHKGRSAVIELAHKMIAMHHLNTLFPGVTCNVTRISSSEQLNVIPDVARCHVSVRAFTAEHLDMAAQALERIAESCSIPGTTATLTRTPGRRPYRATPEVQHLVELAQIEGRGLGWEMIAEGKGGVSDANTLMEMDVPALDSLGPVGGHMHDLNKEYLEVDSLITRAALLAGLIERICLSQDQ
jgi:glutamate carboxypeptidase